MLAFATGTIADGPLAGAVALCLAALILAAVYITLDVRDYLKEKRS